MTSLCDDTYDSYAPFHEIKHFSDAFQRSDDDAVAQFPDYINVIYKAVLEFFDDTEKVCKELGRPYCAHFVKEAFKELLRSYHLEAQWGKEGYVPAVEEYITNGCITSTYAVITASLLAGMEDVAGINEFQWLSTNPRITEASKLVGGLLNDVFTHEEEQKWGDCATAVECYMKEHKVSKEEAAKEIIKMCNNAWKDINEECMKPTIAPRPILDVLVNLARMVEVIYRFDDAYTFSNMNSEITSLFINPTSL